MTEKKWPEVAWNDQDAVDLDLGTKVRINGEVWAFQGFTHQTYVNEWDSMELEFEGDPDHPLEIVGPATHTRITEDPDETVMTTTTEEFKNGERVRLITSTMVAKAVRPMRGGKDYS